MVGQNNSARLAARDTTSPRAPYEAKAWPLITAGLAAMSAALVSIFVFDRIPHVQDSIAQVFQARIFAGGRLWAPAPPAPGLFDYANVVLANGRWYSQYPPGHSLALLPGVITGLPWLVNPLLGGLAIVGVYALGRELAGPRTAAVAALLGVLSPFLLLMSGEFMSHATALCASTFFVLFFFRALRTGRSSDGAAMGAFLGFAVLTRPWSAFGIALPAGIYGLVQLRRRRDLLRSLIYGAAGGSLGVALLLLFNGSTTGDPLKFGYSALAGPGYGLGFGKGLEPHTLGRGLRFAGERLVHLNTRLFEWPLTSLWPAALALALYRKPGWSKWWLLAAFPAGLLAAHIFYWYQDANDCFGPRYLYESLGSLLVISAAGLLAAADFIGPRLYKRDPGGRSAGIRWASAPAGRGFLIALVLITLFSGTGAVFRWPRLLASSVRSVTGPNAEITRARKLFELYGPGYWGVSADLGRAVQPQTEERAIVFVDTRVAPHPNPIMRRAARHLRFGSAFAFQQPYFERARVIYAHMTPEDWMPRGENESAELLDLVNMGAARFPGRRAYYYLAGWKYPRPLPGRTSIPAGR